MSYLPHNDEEHQEVLLGTSNNIHNEAVINNSTTFQNSFVWLNATRLPNANERLMTKEIVHNLIMNTVPMDTADGSMDVLKQTMCFEDSTFLTWEADHDALKSANKTIPNNYQYAQIKALAYRLAFLALHENQFSPARNEAMARYSIRHEQDEDQNHILVNSTSGNSSSTQSMSFLDQYNVGVFDYECDPGTKFLVTNHANGKGFGAASNTQAIDQIHLGMTTGRVVLFMNNIPYGPWWDLRNPYKGSSCERHDIQCKFLPMSPCVLTKDDIENATEISKEAYQAFLKTGKLNNELDDEKVLILVAGGYKDPENPLLRETYVKRIFSMYEDNAHTAAAWNVDGEILEKVKEVIMTEKYFPNHVAMTYILRPNLEAKEEINRILTKVVPADFNPESSIGLAIRASDKCRRESQCMPFDDYMQLVRELAAKRTLARTGDNSTNSSLYDTLVLTSEAIEMIDGRFNYTEREDFPFKIIVNDEDVMQGAGRPVRYWGSTRENLKISPDTVMLSSLTAIKLQLLSESSVLNFCSNFHKMMYSMLEVGCSRSKQNYLEPLLDNDNPKFRMKCGL